MLTLLIITVILTITTGELYPAHPLLIKAYPGIENVQSDLYEVYQEPYFYDLSAAAAVALIRGDGESAIKGEITFMQMQPPVGPVMVRGNITGLPPGKHGLHIHQSGDLRQGCGSLGEHYNPFMLLHGSPQDNLRHVGDLGNVEPKEDGSAEIQFANPLLSLVGGRTIVGRAIVITEKEDDLGRDGTLDSLTTGSSGKPLACGVIAYVI